MLLRDFRDLIQPPVESTLNVPSHIFDRRRSRQYRHSRAVQQQLIMEPQIDASIVGIEALRDASRAELTFSMVRISA